MTRTRYGTCYWVDRLPASRRPSYPRFKGQRRADVVVVGGGAMGCAAAYAFAAAGVEVVLLEADRIARATARSSGLVIHEPEPHFHRLAAQHGIRDARHIYQTARRGSLEYLAALRRLRIECGMRAHDAVQFSSTPEGIERLQREYRARREAGLDVSSLKGAALRRRVGLDGFGLVTHGHATVDPYRATLGLARAAVAKKAGVFEQSAAERIRPLRNGVEVRCNGGTITASHVVLASGYPTDDFKPLRRRFERRSHYVVLTPELPAALRREMAPPGLVLRDAAEPDHWQRWVGDRVLFAGGDQSVPPARARERAIVQRTGQLMYELSVMRPAISGVIPEFAWETEYSATADGVPYFGPHRNYPRHYFALGAGAGGMGLSFAAARILLRHFQERPERGDEPFSFTRIRE